MRKIRDNKVLVFFVPFGGHQLYMGDILFTLTARVLLNQVERTN